MAITFRARSALLLAAARGGSLAGFLVATALLSRGLSKGDYGTFRQVWTLYLALTPIASVGFMQSLFYFLPRVSPDRRWTFVRRTIAVSLFVGLALAALLVSGRDWVSAAMSNASGSHAFVLGGAFIALSIPTQMADGIFMPANRVAQAALFSALNRVVVLVGLALPVWFGGVSLLQGLACLVVVQAVLVALLVLCAHSTYWIRSEARSAETGVSFSEQVTFALPIAGASVFGAIFLQLDKWIAARLMDPEQFAIYSNGAFENPVIALLASASAATVAAELVTLFRSHDKAGFVALWRSMVERLAAVAVPMGVALWVFAPEVVSVLFSQAYLESAGTFRIYVWLTPIRILGFATLFTALNRNRVYLVGHVVACGGVFVAAWPLTSMVGPGGAALAMVAVSYVLTSGFLRVAAKTLGVSVLELLPVALTLRLLAWSGFAGIVARLLVDRLALEAASERLVTGAIVFGAILGAGVVVSSALRSRVFPNAAE